MDTEIGAFWARIESITVHLGQLPIPHSTQRVLLMLAYGLEVSSEVTRICGRECMFLESSRRRDKCSWGRANHMRLQYVRGQPPISRRTARNSRGCPPWAHFEPGLLRLRSTSWPPSRQHGLLCRHCLHRDRPTSFSTRFCLSH